MDRLYPSPARFKLPPGLDGLLRSELEVCVREATLNETDEMIFRRCCFERISRIEVAEELGWSRRTVSQHLAEAISRVEHAAAKLGLT